VLPRAWLASEALNLPDETVLRVVQGGRLADGSVWRPRRTALLSEDYTPFDSSGDGESGQAVISRYEPNAIEVQTSSDAPAILVLGENDYPGWDAFVDGRAVETLRVNYNLRGVALPAGAHHVRFAYRPKSLLLGASLSLLTATLLSLWCFCLRRPRSTAGTSDG
ncbi:MAG TPA: YfhO family protein, partial [Pyrinomonadaceae bacterium]